MTSLSRRRWIAPSLALTLAVGVVGALTGPASAATTSFSQNTKLFVGGPNYSPFSGGSITIPDTSPGSPYPSDIVVTHQGEITDVDVTLSGINHAFPDDLDIMLVGPGGQQVTLMSDAGGGDDLAGKNITFSDSFASNLPDATEITGTTYKPTDFEAGTDGFPAPAPASNHNTSLSVFNGTNAAGTWHLFTRDDSGTDTGFIGGWNLSIDQESTPYPSTISVSGLPAISDVNVKLTGLTSTYPDDLDLLLVGPGGQQATIVGAAGGSDDVTGVNLTLDDEAATELPDGTTLTSGTYKPTNYDGVNVFPAPAPVATGLAPLSVFDGTIPNGVWSLYADDNGGDDLVEIDGWSLDFAWADTVSPSGAVVVNGGAATTSTQSVTLSLNATDPAPATGVSQMRFSNDGVTFSAYQPYATTAAWTLTSGDGVKTVYAQFRDSEGNQSAVVNDSITLTLPDTTGPTVTKTTPKNNAKNVKVTTKVKVKVSEALKSSTVTKKTVFLKAKGSSDKVKAKVTYNSSKKMIVLTPNKALKKNKKYNVTVTTKVKDVAGNAFDAKPSKSGAQALKFSFTTA